MEDSLEHIYVKIPPRKWTSWRTNKIIIKGIKKCPELKKVHWADELDGVLWSHRTTTERIN